MTRVLVVDQELPHEHRDGGAARMVAMLRLLRAEGHDISFASLGHRPSTSGGAADRLCELGIEVVTRGAEDWIRDEGHAVDVVIASRLPVAQAMLPATRRHCRDARFLYDATHVEYLAKFRLAKLTRNQPLLTAALGDRSAERHVVAGADAVVAASDEDADELRKLDSSAAVHVVTAAHATCDSGDLSAAPRTGILFLGFFGMLENELAARRLIDRVWPIIEARAGPTPLTVIGDRPPDWLRDAAAQRQRLTVTGLVDDVDPMLRSAAALLVPLSGGSGIKTKVLHAFSRYLPVIATADGLRGVPAEHGVHVLRGESDAELAEATAAVLTNQKIGRDLARRAAAVASASSASDSPRKT